MLGMMEFLVTLLLQIYKRVRQGNNFENRLRLDRDITMSMVSPFLWNVVYVPTASFAHAVPPFPFPIVCSPYFLSLPFPLFPFLPRPLSFIPPLSLLSSISLLLPSVLWHCWLGGRKGIRPVENWVVRCWRGYLQGADLHMAQLIPLSLTVSCFSKI